MPVELPQILDVSYAAEIAMVEQHAEAEGRFDAGLGIAVPARRRAKLDAPQSKHVKLARGNSIGRGEVRRRVHPRIGVHPETRRAREIGRRNDIGAQESPTLRPNLHRPQQAMADFRARHAAQPVESPQEPLLHPSGYETGFEPGFAFYEIMRGHIVGAKSRDSGATRAASRGSACRSGDRPAPCRGFARRNTPGSSTSRPAGDPAGSRASRRETTR